MSAPSTTSSAMENAAEQYAFYVHGAKVAEKDRERLEAENADLAKKNAELKAGNEQATAALMDIQKNLKAVQNEFDSYEAHESAKIEALKDKTMKLVSEQREQEIALKAERESIENRLVDCKKQELVSRVALAEIAKAKAEIEAAKHELDERTSALVAAEGDLEKRIIEVKQREEGVARIAETQRDKQKEMDTARQSLAVLIGEVDAKVHNLESREGVLADGIKRLNEKEVALQPIRDLATEFKHLAVQYAGDSEKVKAWLEAHCV